MFTSRKLKGMERKWDVKCEEGEGASTVDQVNPGCGLKLESWMRHNRD